MKIVNTDRKSSYLLKDLRNFNKIFRKDETYDNIKSQKPFQRKSAHHLILFRKELRLLQHLGYHENISMVLS